MIPFVATVMGLVIYAVQAKLTLRIRALRAAEGERFDPVYWRIVQRLSVLHILLLMIAVIGIIITVSLLAAPNGFGGREVAYPLALVVGLISIALIVGNAFFLTHVERIAERAVLSGLVTTLSLGIYLGLFLSLFPRTFPPAMALIVGLALGLLVWILLGGWQLMRPSAQVKAAHA
jgi:hypothetical protein